MSRQQASERSGAPVILLIGLHPGHAGMHLPRHLARQGLRVAFAGHAQACAAWSGHVESHWRWDWNARPFSFAPFLGAVERLRPAWIVPLDDLSAFQMEQVGRGTLRDSGVPIPQDIVDLVRRSVGDPSGYSNDAVRSVYHARARSLGIAVPEQEAVHRLGDLLSFAQRHHYPIVAKRERSLGGMGVLVLRSEEDVHRHSNQLRAAGSAPWVVQSHVPGSVGILAVLADQGRVIAQVSAVQVRRRSENPTAPSSVVRLCRHTGMQDAGARFTAAAGLSGFHAWDFIVDDSSRAVMIEHNPRPIAVSTLGGLLGEDLCAALAIRLGLSGAPVIPDPAEELQVALFPDEWRRDPRSRWLQIGHHDAPWDDPTLFAAVLRSGHSFV